MEDDRRGDTGSDPAAAIRRWEPGDVIIRREVLNDGRAWLEFPVVVVRDDPQLLATYVAEGTPFRFPPGTWPTPDGLHPWHAHERWSGHGVLMLQRPGDMYAIWVFWDGPERRFDGWYINIQEPSRRTPSGFDTQDLEPDILVDIDGSWMLKDDDVLEQRVDEGRFTLDQVAAVRAEARRITADLARGRRWWSDEWTEWTPDPGWPVPVVPRSAGR
jgi:hypothetical protein